LRVVLAFVERAAGVRVDAEANLDAAGRTAIVTRFDRDRLDEQVAWHAVAHVRGRQDLFVVERPIPVVVDASQNFLPAFRAVAARRLVDCLRERVLAVRSVLAIDAIVTTARGDDETKAREQCECGVSLPGLHVCTSHDRPGCRPRRAESTPISRRAAASFLA
jgi:hypothetical protein